MMIQTLETTVVHLLREGRALCGQPGVPSSWPAGHRWVAWNRIAEDAIGSEDLMCLSCRDALQRIEAQTGSKSAMDAKQRENTLNNIRLRLGKLVIEHTAASSSVGVDWVRGATPECDTVAATVVFDDRSALANGNSIRRLHCAVLALLTAELEKVAPPPRLSVVIV